MVAVALHPNAVGYANPTGNRQDIATESRKPGPTPDAVAFARHKAVKRPSSSSEGLNRMLRRPDVRQAPQRDTQRYGLRQPHDDKIRDSTSDGQNDWPPFLRASNERNKR